MRANINICKTCNYRQEFDSTTWMRNFCEKRETTSYCYVITEELSKLNPEYDSEKRQQIIFNTIFHKDISLQGKDYPNPTFAIPERCPFILEHSVEENCDKT